MLLSEMLEQKPIKQKTIKVRKVRDLLSGGECFETLTGKKVYIRENNKWYTCMGNKPLNYDFIIIENDINKTCNRCGFCFKDLSANVFECECKDITEQQLQEYFTEGKINCPFWERSLYD